MKLVCIVGPDGSGKSTLSGKLKEALSSDGRQIAHCHTDFGILTEKASLEDDDPHALPYRNSFASVMIIVFRLIRLRWRWHRLRMEDTDVVIQERGWLDQVVDPIRYRNSPKVNGVVRILAGFTPRPDLIIFCRVSPEVVESRKNELSLEEIRRQNDRWEAVLRSESCLWLETTDYEMKTNLAACITLIHSQEFRESPSPTVFSPRGLSRRYDAVTTRTGSDLLKKLIRPQSVLGGVRLNAALFFFSLFPIRPSGHLPFPSLLLRELPGVLIDFAVIRSHTRTKWIACVRTSMGLFFVRIVPREVNQPSQLKSEADLLDSLQKLSTLNLPRATYLKALTGWDALCLSDVSTGCHQAKSPKRRRLEDIKQIIAELKRLDVNHGDLADWNLVGSSPIGVTDWEKASAPHVEGSDLLYYLWTSGRTRGAFQVGWK